MEIFEERNFEYVTQRFIKTKRTESCFQSSAANSRVIHFYLESEVC